MTSEIGRRLAKGSFWISSSQLTAALIGFAGSIVIARLLTPDEYGLIGISLIFPGMIPGLLDLGLSSALIRFTPLQDGKKYVYTAFTIRLFLAVAAGLLLYTFSDLFAEVLSRPYISGFLRVLSIYVAGFMIVESVRNILMGMGKYKKAGLLDVSRALLRVSFSVIFILLGMRVYGAIWGFSAAVITLLVLYPLYYPREYTKISVDRAVLYSLFTYTLPLYVPILLELPLNYTVRIFLARYVTNTEMGNYAVSTNLSLPLIIIGNSLALAIFSSLPILIGDKEKLGLVTRKAVVYTTVIMMPLAITLLAFSKPITFLAYGPKYSLAPVYLTLSSLIGLLAPFGFYVLRAYFDATGNTQYTLRVSLVFLALYVPLGIILITYLRVSGFILAFIISRTISLIFGVNILRKKFNLELWGYRNLVLFTYMLFPAIPVLLIEYYVAPQPSYIKYIVEFIMYITILVFSMVKALRHSEIRELKTLSLELSIVGPMLHYLFDFLEKIQARIHGFKEEKY